VLELGLASSALAIATVALTSRLAPRRPVTFFVALGLIGWAIIDVTVGIAGLLVRDLSPRTLLALSAAWLVLAAWLLRRGDVRRRLARQVGASCLIASLGEQ
jgi:uncharacterized membrane protein YdcZ (DUF606 family)